MSWSWFSAEFVRIRSAEVAYRVKGEAAYLAVHDCVRSDGETTINGSGRSNIVDLRDKLTFVPKRNSVEGWNRFRGKGASVFAVHLGPQPSVDGTNDISDVPPALYFENQNLKATLQKIQGVVDGSGLSDHAYAETLGLLLLWELRHAGQVVRPMSAINGGLTARQLKRVKEFVDAQIPNEITISELAAVAGLSQFHFIRAFKESLGVPPYQYVLSERTRRARELLWQRELSIADVALAVGFSDAPQLNRVFRKFVGVTPTAFRRATGLDRL
jgi:AraC family transcriptional regulator